MLQTLQHWQKKAFQQKILTTKKRILSILEIKKMIPVIDGVFSYVDLELTSDIPKDEHDWRVLTYKEYAFCKNVQDGIRQKATKIYEKQIKTEKSLNSIVIIKS